MTHKLLLLLTLLISFSALSDDFQDGFMEGKKACGGEQYWSCSVTALRYEDVEKRQATAHMEGSSRGEILKMFMEYGCNQGYSDLDYQTCREAILAGKAVCKEL